MGRLSLLSLLACLVGCGEDKSLLITRFIALDPTARCVVKPDGTGISRGLLDVGLVGGTGYVAAPTVTYNDLGGRAIQVTGVDVQLRLPPDLAPAISPGQLNYFVAAAGGVLQSPSMISGITATTSVALPVEVIPAAIAQQLRTLIPVGGLPQLAFARMRAFGTNSDGNVAGPYVDFPIELCNLCLTSPTACPARGTIATGGCLRSQDAPITCCSRSNGSLVCGTDASTATF